MKSEIIARAFIFLLLAAAGFVGFLAAAPGLGFSIPAAAPAEPVTEIHARMPENGGWSTATLHVVVGQPLRLRLTSDDVLHSFAIGQSDKAPVDLKPGEWAETTLVFDKPGRYVFYCTRWCGRNHWRMRGTIIVTGSGEPASAQPKPDYLRLGLDLDAPHVAEDIPAAPPSPDRGAAASARLPDWALAAQTYRENSPSAIWQRLRAEPSLKEMSDDALWDSVAYLWARQTSPEKLAEAAQLYATNCAACHGETGKGDGVMVEGLPRYVAGQAHTSGSAPATQTPSMGDMPGMADSGAPGEMQLSAPPDFTDPHILLGASPALLEGKMLRGGMGTGMPYWGPIFTKDQMDALIAYLYQFALKK